MVDINQLAAVRPERYPLSQPRSELVHTGDDPVLCGASHQWQVDRGAPWVSVRLRMHRFLLVCIFLETSTLFGCFSFVGFWCMMEENGGGYIYGNDQNLYRR